MEPSPSIVFTLDLFWVKRLYTNEQIMYTDPPNPLIRAIFFDCKIYL